MHVTSWEELFKIVSTESYFQNLIKHIESERERGVVYPPAALLFNAFDLTPLECVKVVILGQDPYARPGLAQGLAFSVPGEADLPPSLKNIVAELMRSVRGFYYHYGDLTGWAKQGVFLLNTFLTVRAYEPLSHAKIGWQTFTDTVLTQLNAQPRPIVFLLWGNHAIKKRALITNPRHLVLTSSHPSPLSVRHGFAGCNHFNLANEFLEANGLTPINWSID